MDPFLPGEIPVMVLRYLTANQCFGTAMKLIDEMPRMKDWIPAKPPTFSDTTYLKHILRTSKNFGLKDALWDYENSKILVAELLESDESGFSSCGNESLLIKIQGLQEKLKGSGQVMSTISSTNTGASSLPTVMKVEMSTNTDIYDCPKCLARRLAVKPKADSACQTEEYTAVQFGLRDEIPRIFYRTLLNDGNLQQKIAQTINEHMIDPQGEGENVVQKISSKAESEININKFLEELLKDIPEDSNSIQLDGGLSQLGDPTSFADIEKNLTSMFHDDDDDDSDSVYASTPGCSTSSLTKKGSLVDQDKGTPVTETHTSTNTVTNTSTTITKTPPFSGETSQNGNSDDTRRSSDSIFSPGNSLTPRRSQRQHAVKRITPTPLSSANINPVFNTSVVVEKKTVDFGDKSAKVSVITTNIDKPDWQKLHRRPITPKIPGHIPPVAEPVRVRNVNSGDQVVKLGCDVPILASTPSETGVPSRKKSNSTASSKSSVVKPKSPPPSTHKRKATPVKLTPEKARNIEYNFMHYYHDANKKPVSTTTTTSKNVTENTQSNEVDSAVKKTPLPSRPLIVNENMNPPDSNNRVILLNENAQHEVTPMQPPPAVESSSTSSLLTISPNAIQRLIASANKVGATTSTSLGNFMNNKKKSFSTPRKRKHVRNLTFATPPSLKTVTPGSEPVHGLGGGGRHGTSQKRKATEELPLTDLRSKKRLNWPESEKKNAAANVSVRRTSENLVTSSTSEAQSESDKRTNNISWSTTEATTGAPSKNCIGPPVSGAVNNMSTILEESMSNVSMCATEQPHEIGQLQFSSNTPYTVSSGIEQQQVYPTGVTPITNSPEKLIIVSYPIPGTNECRYFQMLDVDGKRTFLPLNIVGTVSESNPEGTLEQQSLTVNNPQDPSVAPPPPPPQQDENAGLVSHDSSPLSPVCTQAILSTRSTDSGYISTTTPVLSREKLSMSAPSAASSSAGESSTTTTPVDLLTNTKTCSGSTKHSSNESQKQKDVSSDDTSNSVVTPADNESSEPKIKSSRRSKRGETKDVSTKELSPPTTKRSSRTRTIGKSPEVNLEATTKDKKRCRNDRSSEASKSTSDPKDKTSRKSVPKESPELEKGSKKKGKGNSTKEKSKKPAVMFSSKQLFGTTPTRNRTCNSKLPSDVIAAQAVAFQAVPLGSPKKMKMQSGSSEIPCPSSTIQNDFQSAKVSNPNISNDSTPPAQNHAVQAEVEPLQQQQDNVVFNIVPAPLGFPEPTPIKNFAETGCLNISDITCNIGGPLITPFKSLPPAALNETHFTLPPTPRVMLEDTDSNSNSGQSLRLMFDGLYPANLLTSTPMKPGLPRTPGRGSGSSNSQSPLQLHSGKGTGVPATTSTSQNVLPVHQQHSEHPEIQLPVSLQSQSVAPTLPSSIMATSSATTTTADVSSSGLSAILDLSSPRVGDKSDGEISSSDEDDTNKNPPAKKAKSPQKPLPPLQRRPTIIQETRPPVLQSLSQMSYSAPAAQHALPQRNLMSRPPPLQPHIGVSLNPNLKLTHGINFKVGGREKLLTMSEKETLYSLMTMSSRSIENGQELRKETNSFRPVVIKPPQPQPSLPAPQKAQDDEALDHSIIKNLPLEKLLNLVRRKSHPPRKTT